MWHGVVALTQLPHWKTQIWFPSKTSQIVRSWNCINLFCSVNKDPFHEHLAIHIIIHMLHCVIRANFNVIVNNDPDLDPVISLLKGQNNLKLNGPESFLMQYMVSLYQCLNKKEIQKYSWLFLSYIAFIDNGIALLSLTKTTYL